jgi:hypothetical protein
MPYRNVSQQYCLFCAAECPCVVTYNIAVRNFPLVKISQETILAYGENLLLLIIISILQGFY